MCLCGHERRDHRGLRIEVRGPCLECSCDKFTPACAAPESHEQMMEQVETL